MHKNFLMGWGGILAIEQPRSELSLPFCHVSLIIRNETDDTQKV